MKAHAAAPAADARDRPELLEHAGRRTQRRALQVAQWPAVARFVVRGDARLVAGLAQPDRGDKQLTCLASRSLRMRRPRLTPTLAPALTRTLTEPKPEPKPKPEA